MPVRSPLVRPLRPTRSAPFRAAAGPVHVADLLSREGHPLADRVNAERIDPAAPTANSRRGLGFAAGAMLVAGAVVASAFGFNNASDTTPSAAPGEPVGALPSKGAPAGPAAAPAPAVAPDAPDTEQVTNTAADEPAPESAGEIGRAASVKPPVKAPAPAAPVAPAPPVAKAPAAPPAPAAPAQGPVQTLTEPVTNTVGGGTLTNVVAPVTNTVDDTLTPALSLIGGLLGR